MNKWTREQHTAITAPPNLLVSAAAGAGKTAVLTQRIVEKVKKGTDVRSLLVVTFTNAATQEMRQRVQRRLMEAAEEAETPALAAHLREQARIVGHTRGGGNISSLHAFCLYLIQRNFHKLGLDPAFTTADDAQSNILLQTAMEEAAEEHCTAGDPAYLALLHGLRKESILFDYTKALYHQLLSQPDPWNWLEEVQKIYALDAEVLSRHPALYELLRGMQRETAAAVRLLEQARRLVPNDYIKVLAVLDEELMQLRALLLCESYPAYRAALSALTFGRLVFPRGCPEVEMMEQVKALRKKAKSRLQDQQKIAAIGFEESAQEHNVLAPLVEALANFLKTVHHLYTEKKRQRGVIDFSDMEHMALALLEDDEIAARLRARYEEILVDEYQDSSRIQEALLQRIQRPAGNLFLVGDVKQSIYRFRLAEPGLFLEKLQTYTGEPGAPGSQVHLNTNFRSAPRILSTVNAVFSNIMTRETGEMDYDHNAALYPPVFAEDTPLSGCELHLVPRVAREDDPDLPENEAEDAQVEARLCAERIRHLMENTCYYDPDMGGERPLQYSDFVILLRSHRQAAEIWAQVLAEQGIPAYAQLTGGYFEAIEVQVFLNLLRVIDNRRQDIPLLSVLRGVFAFSDEELIRIRSHTTPRPETFFDSLALYRSVEDPLGDKVRAFFTTIDQARRDALLLPLDEFLAGLLEETGFYAAAGVLPGGPQRQANLNALLTRASSMPPGNGDLGSFLHFMDQTADTADLGRAQAGAADVVRILSMHKSKGLEYPVVFLGGLGRTFNRQNRKDDLVLDPELGIGLRTAQPRTRLRVDPLIRKAILYKQQRQQMAEEMRVLYVGMTRAKQRLILLGCMKEPEQALNNARENTVPVSATASDANSFLSWLLPVLAKQPALCVTTLHTRQDIMAVSAPKAPQPEEEADDIRFQRLYERLNWQYPYPGAARTPSKVSVSSLQAETVPELVQEPLFRQAASGLNAAARGTAAHLFLSLLPLISCPETGLTAWLQEQREKLLLEGRMAAAQAEALYLPAIARFLQSPLGKRLCRSARVERELEFSLQQQADQLLGEDHPEPVLLQGVIDCCFMEDGAWVLLDYKTDRIQPGETPETTAEVHRGQLTLYREALTQLSGIPVKEAYVVLLHAGEAVML